MTRQHLRCVPHGLPCPRLLLCATLLQAALRLLAQPAGGNEPAGEPQATFFEGQVERIGSLALDQLQQAEALDLRLTEAPPEQLQALDARGRFVLVVPCVRRLSDVHLPPSRLAIHGVCSVAAHRHSAERRVHRESLRNHLHVRARSC